MINLHSMKHFLLRPLAILIAILGFSSGIAVSAQAATGPWNWTDMSDSLTVRKNRPVWSIGRAEPYWYMTDGQELYTGGHVWKTDGAIVSDITADIRTAGLNRVDDMVSDGQTVLFLKNIASANRNFEVLAYNNGTFSYPAYTWQRYMDTDESIASINGYNGDWIISTSKNRIFRWKQGSNTLTWINPPNIYKSGTGSMLYSVHHTSPADGQSAFSAPVSAHTVNGWLISARDNGGTTRFWRLQSDNTLTDVTSQFWNINFIQAIASNGNQAFVVGGQYSNQTNRVLTFDGYTSKDVSAASNLNYSFWNHSIISYNGKSWMILSDKNLVRFDGANFVTYNQTRDYFVTASGDMNGRTLLGGAVSVLGYSQPTSPLIAKLIRVDEGTGSVAYTGGVSYDTSETIDTVKGKVNNINYWAWFEPNNKNQGNTVDPKYTVGSQSNDGINKIELYINGVRQRVCDTNNSKSNVSCTIFIESTAYVYGADVNVNAIVTSSKGKTATVPVRSVRFYQGASTASGNVTATMSVSNNDHNLYQGQTSNIYVTGYAPAGLSRIEYWVNGSIVYTCNVSGISNSCNYMLYGSNFPKGSTVAFNARVIDVNGVEAWTWLGTYYVTTNLIDNNTYNSGSISVNQWFNPSNTDLLAGAYKIIYANASTANGLQRIEIYVNNSLIQTCNLNRAYGTQICQATIWSDNYSSYSSVPVYVRAYDYNGTYQQSTTQYLYRNGSSNNNSSISTWFDGNVANSDLARNSNRVIKFYGQSNNGLQRLELYVNDQLYDSCQFGVVYGNQSCEKIIWGSNYNNGTTVYLKTKAIDQNGNTAWSSTSIRLNITDTGSNNNNNSNNNANQTYNVYSWIWLDPSNTNLLSGATKTINVGASADRGLNRIEIYVNDSLKRTCSYNSVTGNQTCSISINGNDYSNGQTISIYGRAYDVDNHNRLTNTLYVYRSVTSNTTNQATNITTAVSPDKSTYTKNDTITYTVNASDSDKIEEIVLYKNNAVWRVCAFSNQTSANCSESMSLTDLNSSVSLQAKVTDINSNVTWSDTRILSIQNTYTDNIDIPGTINISSSADVGGYPSNGTITFTASGSDRNGVDRIEIYVNAALVKVCSDATSCSFTGGPYSTYNYVTYGANLYDSLGNRVWTGYKTVNKQ